ncbi:37S ribosomal protein-like protein S5 [Periconia macrospinosa]|uniref:Small ribosomal subunit protein uS5m n=1 Tax=Periconia macrospinosa TaxID=97972 RepID=A0A2V1EFA9_9PLEO|nr:37S ribosomal protein-like protein S5 [Periconia macrospinosa]
MSFCRPVRCLLTTPVLSKPTTTATSKRSFHASTPRTARRRRPHYPSIKASDLNLIEEAAAKHFPKYDTSETALLNKKYTPAQIAAIKAAEAAIDPRDLVTQSQSRSDPWLLPYEDDLAEVDPITDHAEKLDAEDLPGDIEFRRANVVQRSQSMARLMTENMAKMYPEGLPASMKDMNDEQAARLSESVQAASLQAALDPRSVYTSKSPEVLASLADPRYSAILPDLPRIDSRMARQSRRDSTEEAEDPRQKQLLKYLDWDKQQLYGIRIKTLVAHMVTNQTRMGKIRSWYFLSIAGNQNGLIGIGEGKSVEPDDGRKKSCMAAVRNMRPIHRYENRTTYGDLEKKIGATKVQLFARPPGFGLRAQHLIFELARAAGLQDLAARTPRSRNKMNVVKATWEALCNQKLPDEIARARGKKMVDVRKVYYGGSVH